MMRRILIVSGKVYGVGAEGVPDEGHASSLRRWGPKHFMCLWEKHRPGLLH